MLGSVAEDVPGSRPPDVLFDWVDRLPAIAVGAGLIAVAFLAYWLPGSDRIYNHFVWQALAFLDGRAAIDWPVPGFPDGNDWMQDVYPLSELTGDPQTTGALLPFPPLPAIVLMPFVAIWGLATDIRNVSVLSGVLGVGIAWWMLGRIAITRRVRLATAVFFALGTAFWYAAQHGATWFFAHVVAVAFVLLAIGVALGADRDADAEVEALPSVPALAHSLIGGLRRPLELIDRRQFLAGLLFGIACTARLTVVFGAPFFMLVGGGGSWVRRSFSAGLGAIVPVGLLLAYNLATTGHVLHPGYEFQYQKEARDYQILGYHPDWDIEDARYLPQNVGIMLGSTPALFPAHELNVYGQEGEALCQGPDDTRGIFDPECPIAAPRAIGMSILLTSPALLLAGWALFRHRSRLVAGACLAVLLIAIVNLMHFSQGWVQFGYRFGNDFVAFALPLVAVGMQRRGGVGLLGFWLVAVAVAVNLWGVIWGNILRW